MENKNKRFRRCAVTYFNEDWEPVDIPPQVSYILGQKEVAPSTGKIHWQLYLEFTGQVSLVWIKKNMFNHAHIEEANGNAEQNKAYCSKNETAIPGTFFEKGEPKVQGKRTDIEGVVDKIHAGATFRELASSSESAPVLIKYYKGVHAVINACSPQAEIEDLTVEWHWGVSGAGKTHGVYARFGYEDIYRVCLNSGGTCWFDGYTDQKVILFDDCEDVIFGMSRSVLLGLTDKYPFTLPIKGGSVMRRCSHIIFTSNKCPTMEWLPIQLFRRIKAITEYTLPFPGAISTPLLTRK